MTIVVNITDSNTHAVAGITKTRGPNPFNPLTQIRFALPQENNVKLEIFNLLGERIATLVDETRQASDYTEQFDATGLASGLYFYRIQAGDFVDTKKLLLLK